MSTALKYEKATWQSNIKGCTPGCVGLVAGIRAAFPEMLMMTNTYGCWVDRSIAGTKTPSLHREGRAIDIGVPERYRGDGGLGWILACELAGMSAHVGIQQIIWDRHSWRCDRPRERMWRRLSQGTPAHLDHIHAELTWRGASSSHTAAVAGVLHLARAAERNRRK